MPTDEVRAERLRARLADLEKRVSDAEETLTQSHSTDWEEAAIEREGDEVLQDLERVGVAEIAQIRAALARIAAGTYGICTRCGEEISEARLDLVPETPFCKRCA